MSPVRSLSRELLDVVADEIGHVERADWFVWGIADCLDPMPGEGPEPSFWTGAPDATDFPEGEHAPALRSYQKGWEVASRAKNRPRVIDEICDDLATLGVPEQALEAIRSRKDDLAAWRTPCCGYDTRRGDRGFAVIMWNPYNQVVQCHNCGAQYHLPPREHEESEDDDGSNHLSAVRL